MIKFDKIKILTKSEYLSDLNPDIVEARKNVQSESFVISQKQPFNLLIQQKPFANEAIIEFSSKILLNDYPQLININTIHQCFDNIVKGGYCKLQIDNIINDSSILSCDITNDISEIVLPKYFKPILISNLRNMSKIHVENYGKSGHTIVKLTKTKQRQIRFIIYDKYRELNLKKNLSFLNKITNKDAVMNYFKNKYRIEANIKTLKQIRDYCQTEDTQLLSVLNSNENPLVKIFDDIFIGDTLERDLNLPLKRTLFDSDSLPQLKERLILKACNNDLSQVMILLETYLSPNTNKRKYIPIYRELLNSTTHFNQNNEIIRQIRDHLVA